MDELNPPPLDLLRNCRCTMYPYAPQEEVMIDPIERIRRETHEVKNAPWNAMVPAADCLVLLAALDEERAKHRELYEAARALMSDIHANLVSHPNDLITTLTIQNRVTSALEALEPFADGVKAPE